MEERIDCLMDTIVSCVEKYIEEHGLENMDIDEMGKVADQIKDLAEAKYHLVVVEAMHNGKSIPYVSNTMSNM